MRTIITLTLFFLLTVFSVSAQCVEPQSNLNINESIVLCSGTYDVENILITGDNLDLTCNETVLQGNQRGSGITIDTTSRTLVQGCTLQSYEVGVYVTQAEFISVVDNTIDDVSIGIAGVNAQQNNIDRNTYTNVRRQEVQFLSTAQETQDEEQISEEVTPSSILQKQIALRHPEKTAEQVEKEVQVLLDTYFNDSQEKLHIKRMVYYNSQEQSTEITLTIVPQENVQNVSIYESIPKCVSEFLNQIVFSNKEFEIIEEDPLIMWHFNELESPQVLSYKVFKRVEPQCYDLLYTFGLVQQQRFVKEIVEDAEEEKTIQKGLWFTILIILLGVLIVFFRIKK